MGRFVIDIDAEMFKVIEEATENKMLEAAENKINFFLLLLQYAFTEMHLTFSSVNKSDKSQCLLRDRAIQSSSWVKIHSLSSPNKTKS